MGKVLKARPNKREGFGILGRAMEIKDPQVKAAILQQAAHKLAEYREANFGLAQENERLKVALESALKRIAELTGMPWPPKTADEIVAGEALPMDTPEDVDKAEAYINDPANADKYDEAGVTLIRAQIQAARERLQS